MFRPIPLFAKVGIIGVFLVCIFALVFFRYLKSPSELSEDKFVEVYVQLSITKELLASDTLSLNPKKKTGGGKKENTKSGWDYSRAAG